MILAEFTDTPHTYAPATWAARMFGATGSVRDYYLAASYGTFTLNAAPESSGTADDGIVGWVNVGATHPDTGQVSGDANKAISAAAITQADSFVNFAAFDTDADGAVQSDELHVTVIVAGAEASYQPGIECPASVWGHNWALNTSVTVDGKKVGGYIDDGSYSQFGERHCTSSLDDHQATVGIMAHELGHDLEMPDLYNTDDFSDPGAGEWTVMAGGSWGSAPGAEAGSSPAMLDPFLRSYQGWVAPSEITTAESARSLPASYSSPSVLRLGANPSGVDWTFNNAVYDFDLSQWVPIPGSGEYFLVENRAQTGYDAGLPGCGVLVWHIDETRTTLSGSNNDPSRRLVSVVPADGAYTYGDSGDPMPGTSNITALNDATTPSTRWYDATSSGFGISVPAPGCSATASVDITTPPPPTAANLLVTRTGDGAGTVTSLVAGIACGVDCVETYPLGTQVQLSAVASLGSTFTGWSGACTGTLPSCTVSMTESRTATATFVDPPGVVITAPTDPGLAIWKATFDESVGPVTSTNFVLRLAGTTTNLTSSTLLGCKNSAGTAISCNATNVRTATLQLYPAMLPGQGYDARVSPTASGQAKDVSGNPVPATSKLNTRLLKVQAESAATAPIWGAVTALGKAYGGNYATERLAGSSARFYFPGSATSVTWYSAKGPAQGKADVYVDGVKKTQANNYYSGATTFGVKRTYSSLGTVLGQHVIEIRPLGLKGATAATGTFVAVDAFHVNNATCPLTGTAPSGCTLNPAMNYSWSATTLTTPAAKVVRSDQAGATLWLRFKGTRATVYRLVGPTQGKMVVQLYRNGTTALTAVTVDNYSPTVAIKAYTTPITTTGTHQLRVSVLRQKHASATGYMVSIDNYLIA